MTKAERKAHQDKMDRIHKAAQAIVATGKCPDCGSKLRRNLSLAGWWQCGRFGNDNFRIPEYRGTGNCDFQTFTE